jgi:hypothetical protein
LKIVVQTNKKHVKNLVFVSTFRHFKGKCYDADELSITYFPHSPICQSLFQNLMCLIRQCISGLNVPRRFIYWWWWNTTLLSGSESDKRDEIMDRVGWLKESFDRYSRINCFINNYVGHLCWKFGDEGVSRNDKQKNMRN